MAYYLRGQIAKMAGINIETLRYYEKNNLIPVPMRSQKGYRLYPEEILPILSFIRRAKHAGFTLEQIKQLFSAVERNKVNLDYVETLIDSKLTEIEERIVDLQNTKSELIKIKGNIYEPHQCPLINSFINA